MIFDPDRIAAIRDTWRFHVTDAMTLDEHAELDRIAVALSLPIIGHISARRSQVFGLLAAGDIERDGDKVRYSAAYVARNDMPAAARDWKYSYQGD